MNLNVFIIFLGSCKNKHTKNRRGNNPGGPVVNAYASTAEGMGLISGWETKILNDLWCSQKQNKKKTAENR